VNEAIRKAETLVEALGWIRRFRQKLVVIKLGGSALEDEPTVHSLLTDVLFMEAVGMRPVLVHGGGKAINRAMDRAGLVPKFIRGRRYTDAATLEIVARVLAGEICVSLVRELEAQGGRAAALSDLTSNVLRGRRIEIMDESGDLLDLGLVGEVIGVDRAHIEALCAQGTIPVIPSIAVDESGQRYNVNADTAAAAVARLLQACKLVFVSDVPGVLLRRDDPESLASHLNAARCKELIADGTIDRGMIPKIDAALEALRAGVEKVHMIDGRMPHSLLLEVYSNRGVGTEIVL
jgi:acetylglutamate kinase